MRSLIAPVASVLLSAATSVAAQDHLTEAKASFIFNGERIKISRDNPQAAHFAMRFAGTADACGGPCIAPMTVAEGVTTLGEIEVLEFLTKEVADNTGLMVDARQPQERSRGFIPGTVNLPASTVAPGNSFRDEILRALGARMFDGIFNFADARKLLVYDSGPASDDAAQLVRNLLDAGYPAEKITYYRGGMQVWSILGFSIEQGAT